MFDIGICLRRSLLFCVGACFHTCSAFSDGFAPLLGQPLPLPAPVSSLCFPF